MSFSHSHPFSLFYHVEARWWRRYVYTSRSDASVGEAGAPPSEGPATGHSLMDFDLLSSDLSFCSSSLERFAHSRAPNSCLPLASPLGPHGRVSVC